MRQNIPHVCLEEKSPQDLPRQQKGGFHKWRIPKKNGWFIMENPIKMDELGVPPFSETLKSFDFDLWNLGRDVVYGNKEPSASSWRRTFPEALLTTAWWFGGWMTSLKNHLPDSGHHPRYNKQKKRLRIGDSATIARTIMKFPQWFLFICLQDLTQNDVN